MNIVIPAAGAGRRFAEAGYEKPKPFIDTNGRPMIERVIDNIAEPGDRVYVLMRTDHLQHVKGTSLTVRDNVCFIMVDELTEGAACTVLRARGFIDNGEGLIIANSDQYVEYDRGEWRNLLGRVDGAIMTFPAQDRKWSYAATDEDGRVTRVAEKEVISERATVGIYYFCAGSLFAGAADRMMNKDIRVNNEFYVCPTYNEIVGQSMVRTFDVQAMYGLGTPEDFEANAGRLFG